MSRAEFPYHFCQAPQCHEMVPGGATYCEAHLHFIALKISPDASQEQHTTSPVGPSDAGFQKESQS